MPFLSPPPPLIYLAIFESWCRCENFYVARVTIAVLRIGAERMRLFGCLALGKAAFWAPKFVYRSKWEGYCVPLCCLIWIILAFRLKEDCLAFWSFDYHNFVTRKLHQDPKDNCSSLLVLDHPIYINVGSICTWFPKTAFCFDPFVIRQPLNAYSSIWLGQILKFWRM